MTTKQTSKYTADMEARIVAEAPLNQAKAEALATEFGSKFSARSVIAKATRMGVTYERKQPTTKSGLPVEHKADLVTEISKIVEGNLDGLDKAPKAALQALRNYLTA